MIKQIFPPQTVHSQIRLKGDTMSSSTPYLPQTVFSDQNEAHPSVPRVLIAPSRYIQGDGVLDHLGRYLSIVPSKRAAILFSVGGQRRFGERLLKSLKSAQVESTVWDELL